MNLEGTNFASTSAIHRRQRLSKPASPFAKATEDKMVDKRLRLTGKASPFAKARGDKTVGRHILRF